MADEQTEDRTTKVSLPSGSFELRDLGKALGKAIDVKDREQWPERINDAIVQTIVNPEVLANYAAPSVPTGASLVEQEIDYGNGNVQTREVVTFDGVDAESGEDAAKMKYAESRAGDETLVVDEGDPVLPLTDEAPPSLATAAAAAVDDNSGTGKNK